MSGPNPKPRPVRKPVKKQQAPAVHKGLQPLDPAQLLAQATPEQIQTLTQENFALWARMSGIEVDNRNFSFDDRRYLLPIYLDNSKELTWMKAAQTGATVYQLLRLLWYARHHRVKCGLFFPTADGVTKLSKDRLGPMISSNLDLFQNTSEVSNTLGLKQIGNIYNKLSSLYMLYMGGQASKDSVPLDIIAFDEVRLMKEEDIDQAEERTSASDYKIKIFMSTAGLPNCFAGDTKVVVRHKESGFVTEKDISSLIDCYEHYQALSYNRRGGNRTRWRDITGAVCRGKRVVVRVRLWNGYEIVCTPDHRFAQLADHSRGSTLDWTPIVDVKRYPTRFGGLKGPSEGVLCVNQIPELMNPRWGVSKVMAPYCLATFRVMGAFIAEGTLTDSGELQIWQSKEGAIQSYVSRWARDNGLSYRVNNDGIFVQLNPRQDLISLFMQCGSSALDKKIPAPILEGSKQQLDCLLEGLLDGDGHRRKERTKTRESNREWDYFTSSEVLADQLLFVGLKIGKPLTLCEREARGETFIGEQKAVSLHTQYTVSYNPKSFRSSEVFPELGNIAVSSVENAGEEVVYDLEIEGNPWFVLAESGCLVHNSDIHRRFLRGTQLMWHVKCGCKFGFVPSDHFPDCVVDTGKEIYMRCPKCKMRINDAMNGNYIPHNPGAEFPSYHISQLVSRKISIKEVWEMYQRTTNMKEFYNAKLGKPYIDVENMPLTDEVLEGAVDYDLRWAYQPGADKTRKKWCAMGVDQHSGNCYAILAKMGSDGRKELVHAEVIDSSNPRYWVDGKPVSPFRRIHELIREFDVRMCVCDAMPNANEAQDLARTFPGKVFIAWYSDSGQDMVRWTDRAKTREAIRKGSKQLRLKWQVVLNRYQTIDFLLNQWIGGVFRMPDPRGLSQVAKNEKTGRHEMENIITARLFIHLKSMIRQQTITNEETGKFKMEWVYAGRDPHFTHACNYLNIAMERLKKQARFTLV